LLKLLHSSHSSSEPYFSVSTFSSCCFVKFLNWSCSSLIISDLVISRPDDVVAAFACYDTTLRSLLDKHAPLELKRIRTRSSARWYDRECIDAKRATRKLERRPEYRRLYLTTYHGVADGLEMPSLVKFLNCSCSLLIIRSAVLVMFTAGAFCIVFALAGKTKGGLCLVNADGSDARSRHRRQGVTS